MTTSSATIETTDNKEWTITYQLSPARTIPDGNLAFSIYCESKAANVPLPSKITNATNGKKVLFDGTNPIVEYIPKEDRVDEIIEN